MRLCLVTLCVPFLALAADPMDFAPFMRTVTSLQANLQNVAYRWVASDITNNPATNWIDRIQGHVWTNADNAVRPVVSINYITFDSTHWLTSTPPTLSSNCAVGFVMNMLEPASGTHPGIWLGPGGDTCTTNYLGIGLESGGANYALRHSPGCDTINFLGARYGSLTNVIHTMVLWNGPTNGANGFRACFTNSVAAGSVAGAITSWTAGAPVTLGRNIFRASGPTMRIYEMWIWTNAVTAIPGTDSIVANFHQYATNAYAF